MIEAPAGSPSRPYVRVSAGMSTSVASAVKVRVDSSSTAWLGIAFRTGAVFAGTTVND